MSLSFDEEQVDYLHSEARTDITLELTTFESTIAHLESTPIDETIKTNVP